MSSISPLVDLVASQLVPLLTLAIAIWAVFGFRRLASRTNLYSPQFYISRVIRYAKSIITDPDELNEFIETFVEKYNSLIANDPTSRHAARYAEATIHSLFCYRSNTQCNVFQFDEIDRELVGLVSIEDAEWSEMATRAASAYNAKLKSKSNEREPGQGKVIAFPTQRRAG